MPTKDKGEKANEFISRCMKDKEMKKEYPNKKQRLAACFRNQKAKAKKSLTGNGWSAINSLKEQGHALSKKDEGIIEDAFSTLQEMLQDNDK